MKDLKKEKEGLRPLETGIKYVLEDGHYYLVNEGTGEKERLYFKSELLEERKKTLEEVLEIMGCTVTDRFISGIDPKDEKLDKIISLYVKLTTK